MSTTIAERRGGLRPAALVTAAALLLASQATAGAPVAGEKQVHKLMGTVSSGQAPGKLDVRTREGPTVSVVVTPLTRIRKGTDTASGADVRQGERIVVSYVEEGQTRTATELRLAESGVPAPDSRTAPQVAEARGGPQQALQAFHDALAAGDRAVALGLMAPDVVIFEEGGAQLSRDDYAADHLGADLAFARATERSVLAEQSGGDDSVAWVLTQSRTTGSFKGRDVASHGVETAVLRRMPEGWRITHLHWSAQSLKH